MPIPNPSGRTTPLVIDHGDYGSAVLLQGGPVSWGDPAALVGYLRQVQSLLDPDLAYLDVEALLRAHLAATPSLAEAMGARSRTGYALRALLGDDDGVQKLRTVITTVKDSVRRDVALAVPSPARFLPRAHAVAGTDISDVTEDHADSASMYVAEWLGRLGGLPVGLVLFDARASDGEQGGVAAESLAAYSSLTNVGDHLCIPLAMRSDEGIEMTDGDGGGVVPDEFWTGAADAPEAGEWRLAHIPAEAKPEVVLERVAALK